MNLNLISLAISLLAPIVIVVVLSFFGLGEILEQLWGMIT